MKCGIIPQIRKKIVTILKQEASVNPFVNSLDENSQGIEYPHEKSQEYTLFTQILGLGIIFGKRPDFCYFSHELLPQFNLFKTILT